MALEVKELWKRYGDRTVVDHISFTLEKPGVYALLGRNGAGKTTTIRMILGMLASDGGEVLWNGKPMADAGLTIGYLAEERGLYPKYTLMDQLLYFAALKGVGKAEAQKRIRYWAERLEVEEYLYPMYKGRRTHSKIADQLSKGNQQKIQLMAALLADPEFIILDEPLSGLDPVNADLFKSIIREEIQKEKYLIMSSHQMSVIEEFCEDITILNRGRAVLQGNLNEIKKTRLAYDSITVQLSKKNTRFQYKLIKKGGRASEFENAIEWLCLSGIVSRVYRAEQIKKPLENYRDIDAFKIYVSDLGLLCAKKDLAANDVLYMVEELNDFKGGMVENYVNVQLTINGYATYYWESDRGAEVDFVIQREGQLIPIEVKAADNTRAKSLAVYMKTYKPAYALKLSAKNFGFEDGKKTVPLYAVFCI